MDFQLKIKLKCQFKDTDDIRDYFLHHERLKGYEIGVHTKYAERLEYGCGPLRYVSGENYEQLVKDLTEWARVKFNISDREAKDMGEAIADRFWNFGVPPHNYFRPAILWLDNNKQQLFNEGKSIGDICHMAENRIIDEIMRQNLIYKGTLLQSVSCRPLDDKEMLSKDTHKVSREDMERKAKNVEWK